MSYSSLYKLVREQPFLKGFSTEHIKKIAATASEVHFAADQIIFQEGGRLRFFYLLLSGRVALEVCIPGHVLRIQTLEPGDELGWSSMLAGEETQFRARALTAVHALGFESREVLAICEEDPMLGYRLMLGLLGIAEERLKAVREQLLSGDHDVAPAAV